MVPPRRSAAWIAAKIRRLRHEGYGQRQAVAIAERMAEAPPPKTRRTARDADAAHAHALSLRRRCTADFAVDRTTDARALAARYHAQAERLDDVADAYSVGADAYEEEGKDARAQALRAEAFNIRGTAKQLRQHGRDYAARLDAIALRRAARALEDALPATHYKGTVPAKYREEHLAIAAKHLDVARAWSAAEKASKQANEEEWAGDARIRAQGHLHRAQEHRAMAREGIRRKPSFEGSAVRWERRSSGRNAIAPKRSSRDASRKRHR